MTLWNKHVIKTCFVGKRKWKDRATEEADHSRNTEEQVPGSSVCISLITWESFFLVSIPRIAFSMPVPVGANLGGPSTIDKRMSDNLWKLKGLYHWGKQRLIIINTVKMGAMMGGSKLDWAQWSIYNCSDIHIAVGTIIGFIFGTASSATTDIERIC